MSIDNAFWAKFREMPLWYAENQIQIMKKLENVGLGAVFKLDIQYIYAQKKHKGNHNVLLTNTASSFGNFCFCRRILRKLNSSTNCHAQSHLLRAVLVLKFWERHTCIRLWSIKHITSSDCSVVLPPWAKKKELNHQSNLLTLRLIANFVVGSEPSNANSVACLWLLLW